MGACVIDYSSLPILCPFCPSNHLSCPFHVHVHAHLCSVSPQQSRADYERMGTDKLGVAFAVAVARRLSRRERERERGGGYGIWDRGNRYVYNDGAQNDCGGILAHGMGESTRTANPTTCNAMQLQISTTTNTNTEGDTTQTHTSRYDKATQPNTTQHNTTQDTARHGTARTIRENRFG
jgi:hypothetical protein